ncbi:hypothetical protein ACQPXS_02540 [Streptomyces sp. CA-142005]|uniref:hypothetical protein n=1 Tax=Streptomyces sp. CA-142005 TaxID=3240052 RepID=UPI003D91A74B
MGGAVPVGSLSRANTLRNGCIRSAGNGSTPPPWVNTQGISGYLERCPLKTRSLMVRAESKMIQHGPGTVEGDLLMVRRRGGVDEDGRASPVQLLEQRFQARVSEIHAVCVGLERDAVAVQLVLRELQFGQGAVHVGQRH